MTKGLIDEKSHVICWMAKLKNGRLAPYYCGAQRKMVWQFMVWNTSRTKQELKSYGWAVVKVKVNEL